MLLQIALFHSFYDWVVVHCVCVGVCVCISVSMYISRLNPCPSTEDWINKMWHIYIMEYYLAIKKNEIMPFAATWMQLEIFILSEVRNRKTDTTWCHFYVESKIWHKWMYLQNRNRLKDMENRLVVAKGEGVGWIGNFGLIDANYCLWNGLAMRSCCAALGTMFRHLRWSLIMWVKRMYTCMSSWVTMLYSRKKKVYWGNNNEKFK